MSKVKIIMAGLALLLIFSLLPGCSNLRYGAKLYNNVDDWIDESFLNENRVKAYYPNDNYVYGENDSLIYEETAPSSRVFIITDEDEYNGIFTDSPLDIDFESKIIILYIFPKSSPRDYKLKRMELKDKVLTVEIRLEWKWKDVKDEGMAAPSCIVITMNKAEINEVKFEK